MRAWIAVLPLAVFAIMATYFAMGLREDPSALPSQLIDAALPVFELPPIEGSDTGLSSTDLEGEVALLSVFGSWCPPCLVEHPVLMQIARESDVPIYGLNWRDEPGAGAAWLQRHGNPYQAVGADRDGRVAIDMGVIGAPETFVIDAQGRVRYRHIGVITPQFWTQSLEPLIEELRSE